MSGSKKDGQDGGLSVAWASARYHDLGTSAFPLMMGHDTYESVIGLEVHCQLSTASKAFSPESAAFGAAPNTHVDPISLGHPGTLPVLNEEVVAATVQVGLATHCRIAPRSILARKHYFYPDLPKGYQISQYETPLCYDGYILIEDEEAGDGDSTPVRIGITRIHIEEDAGKSLHDQDPFDTLLDYNRCGVPLIEIVSEPDLRSPREAYLYVQKIRQIVRYLGVCDGNMEEGSLRCDANVSIRVRGAAELGTKTEIKNMNSFRNVERALAYEISRQIRLVESGGEVVQETRLWDASTQETRPMRSKEEAHDYRYFPDPDLVPVVISPEDLASARAALPEMPAVRRARFMEAYGLPAYDAGILTEERGIADYFEETLDHLARHTKESSPTIQAKAVSNFVMTDILRLLKEQSLAIEDCPIEPRRLALLIDLRLADKISSTGALEVFNAMLEDDRTPERLATDMNLLQVTDVDALGPVVEHVLEAHTAQVQLYLKGKEGLIGFFIGQVMRTFDGAPDPQLVRRLLQERLQAMRN